MNRTSVRMLVRRGSIRSLAEGSYEPRLQCSSATPS